MPFKTKRQKIAAQSRRYIFSEGTVSLVDPEAKKKRAEDVNHVDGFDKDSGVDDRLLLKKEVFKILLVSSLIIISQITLRLTLF